MKRVLIALLLVIALMAAAGCSRIKTIPLNELHMAGSTFTEKTASIKAGKVIKFIDDAGGPSHNLVVGTNGIYQAMPGAPTQLVATATYSGLAFNSGQEIDVTFSQPGTYTVTCTIHPTMLATVTVT